MPGARSDRHHVNDTDIVRNFLSSHFPNILHRPVPGAGLSAERFQEDTASFRITCVGFCLPCLFCPGYAVQKLRKCSQVWHNFGFKKKIYFFVKIVLTSAVSAAIIYLADCDSDSVSGCSAVW